MPVSTLPRQLAALFFALASWACAADRDGPVCISHGEQINLAEHLVPGKTVIVAFYSEFSPGCPCERCHRLGNPLEALAAARDDVAVVMVDINRPGVTRIDWNSPVAMQFSLRSLPSFKVFGPDGKLVSEDDPQNHEASARDLVHSMIEALPAHGTAMAATN